jgi:HAD superfamily hydrolase (TIGR01509 family)
MWLFVDFDGTLVDSLNVARLVYEGFVVSCGGQPSDDEFRSLNGPSLSEIVERIALRVGEKSDRSTLLHRYTTMWAAGYDTIQPKAGAMRLLHEARGRGLKIAIVTSASRRFVERYVQRAGWGGLIDQTVSGDQVAQSKPDPAIYQVALGCTEASAGDVLALEDSINGIKAAVAAGIQVVVGLADGGAYSHTAAQLRSVGATRVIATLDDFFAGDAA